MHYLGVAFISMIQGLATWFAVFMTRRVAVVTSVIAIWVVLIGAFTAGVDSALSAVGSLAPPGIVAGFRGLMPGNLALCLGLLLAAHLGAVIFRMKSYLLQMYSLKAGTGGL